MNMKQIFSTDISERKEFSFDGDTLKFEEILPNGFWWYKRYNSKGTHNGNEIVIPIKHKQPDGTIVRVYPSTEQFGKYGWYFPPRMEKEELIAKGDEILARRKPKNNQA